MLRMLKASIGGGGYGEWLHKLVRSSWMAAEVGALFTDIKFGELSQPGYKQETRCRAR